MGTGANRRACGAARGLLDRAGVEKPQHINVEAMAWMCGIEIVDGGLEGAAARLVHDGARGRIRLSTRIEHPGARRFSIAHELGHLLLDHQHDSTAMICREPGMLARPDNRADEAAANAFAAELLMPEFLVGRACQGRPVDLGRAHQIAAEFGTSVIASALRFVELSDERCAVAFCQRGAVAWAARSSSFAADLPRGRRLDPHCLAEDYFERGAVYLQRLEVPADTWIPVDHGCEVGIVEHSLPMPGLDAVLTLLWLPKHASERLEWLPTRAIRSAPRSD